MAANPIMYTEIKAYCEFNKLDLSPFETDLLVGLDRLFMTETTHVRREESKKENTGKAK